MNPSTIIAILLAGGVWITGLTVELIIVRGRIKELEDRADEQDAEEILP